ncbi:MAG: IPT/TIG domain-containing protein [Acidobacteriia bacterium]|nr:IPT/TIG domain-containing protein [Terriglobia bacterium]
MIKTHAKKARGLAVLAFIAVVTTALHAQTYTPLYTFPETDRNNTGIFSQLMAQGRDGNFYSTIATGGAHKGGSAYKMTTSGQFTTIYDFCALPSCADGSNPLGGLTLGFDGNLYGTTAAGGKNGAGTIFKLTPSGTLTTLWNFDNGDGGGAPNFTLLQGQDKNLYGVSNNQYTGHYGAFYKISLSGKFTPLHQFTYTDGNGPNLPTQSTDGNFYGTAVFGGAHNYGVVYKMTPQGVTTVLHDFAAGTTDGAYPEGVLVQGNDGAFYGLTARGGTKNVGTVFKITASGTFTLLYSFAGYNTDGAIPYAGLTLGTDGNFYGSTANGGTKNAGMLFQVTPAGVETKLYNFCDPTCDPGFYPEAPLVQHTNGKFYGLTTGNSLGGGVFYSLDMGLKQFVNLLNWQGKVNATVEMLGQGFTGTTQVSFNGTPAPFNNVSDTYMTATVPAGATTGVVTVSIFTGTMKSNRKFLVTPQILNFDPDHGPVGTPVTITGQSLTQTKGVGFGNTKPAQFTVISDTEVSAIVPLGAKSGWVGIQTAGGIVTFGNFLVTPAVLNFSPKSGPVGTPVRIKGTSFKGTTKVTFGGVAATSYQVISDTEVDALVPTGAVTGPIAVTTPSGTGTSSQNFTVTP